MNRETPVSLEGIDNGKLGRLFQEKLSEVLENCNDILTPANAARKITITISLTPGGGAKRRPIELTYKITSSLPDAKTDPISLYPKQLNNRRILVSFDAEQERLPLEQQMASKTDKETI